MGRCKDLRYARPYPGPLKRLADFAPSPHHAKEMEDE